MEQPTRRHRTGWTSIIVVGAVVALLAAALVLIGGQSSRRHLSATGSGRLPDTIVERWVIESASVVDSSTLILVDDAVVHQTSKQPFSDVVAIDIETGRRRWAIPGDQIGNVRMVGPFADQVVVLQAFDAEATLFGLAASDGELLWEHTPAPRSTAGALPGSDLITVSSTTDEETRFIDPLTGASVGVVDGSPVANDLNGRWFFRSPDGVVSHADLRNHWSEPAIVGTLAADAPSAAVGEQLLVATDRIRIVGRGAAVTIRDQRAEADVDGDGSLPVFNADVVRLASAGGQRVLLATRETLYGGELGDTGLSITWSRPVQLRDVLIVADGVFVEVVSPIDLDAADFTERAPTLVLDARTGAVITEAGGDLRSTDLLGVVNGIVVPRRISSATRPVGVDLDGADLWTLPHGEIVAIGNGVLVTIETTGSSSVVRAYASA